MKDQVPYHAYLLKLWPVISNENTLWRLVLENPYTGKRLGFKDLEAFVHFLRSLTQGKAGSTDDEHLEG
jgi:hypothetical protein